MPRKKEIVAITDIDKLNEIDTPLTKPLDVLVKNTELQGLSLARLENGYKLFSERTTPLSDAVDQISIYTRFTGDYVRTLQERLRLLDSVIDDLARSVESLANSYIDIVAREEYKREFGEYPDNTPQAGNITKEGA